MAFAWRYVGVPLLVGGVSLGASMAHAGGIMLYEVATDNVGLANAGAAARAQGPGTIASNPAGMSYLPGTQVTGALQALYGDISFDSNGRSNSTGGEGGNALPPMPGASFFVTHQLDDQWSVGFGSYGDFGLSLDYDDDWSGRYFAQDGTLLGVSLVPSVAYRADEHWSFGFGLKAMYGVLQVKTAIDRAPLGFLDRQDGKLKYEDSAWGYGANLGVIYQPQEGTRLGLAYTSQIDLDFSDRLQVSGGGAALQRVDGLHTGIEMRVPQTVSVSLYQQLDPQWALLASVNWQDWSEFGELSVAADTSGFGAVIQEVDAQYKDTYHLSFGAQYQVNKQWLWNAGLAYDSSAVDDADRTFSNPMGESYRLATGVTYALDQDTDLNLSWALIWLGDMSVDQQKNLSGDRTAGQFENAWIQTIAANATWRF
jgi:long-chain fatty acid transport protein